MSLIDAAMSNTTEISAGVSNVTLNNPAESSDQDEKAAINAITRSFMQCEQTTKRMQGVSTSILFIRIPNSGNVRSTRVP